MRGLSIQTLFELFEKSYLNKISQGTSGKTACIFVANIEDGFLILYLLDFIEIDGSAWSIHNKFTDQADSSNSEGGSKK